jgi:RHS repeat-associated protein
MKAISSQAAGTLENKFKYNGGNELQSKEFSDGSGLETYDAVHRMYDAQLGRFHQQDVYSDIFLENSPYTFASNNPILFNDPLGLSDSTDSKGNVWHELKVVTVKSTKNNNSSNYGMEAFTTMVGYADTYFEVFSKNNIAIQGKFKPIPIGMKRMSQQAKIIKLNSYSIKNTGLGLSLLANVLTFIQVRNQYLNGGLSNINPVDGSALVFGTTGLFANIISKAGLAPKAMGTVVEFTGVGGLVLGTYQSWMTAFQIMYNTNLPNNPQYSGDVKDQFDASMNDQKTVGNNWP